MARKVKKSKSKKISKKVKRRLKWTKDMKKRRELFGSLLGF